MNGGAGKGLAQFAHVSVLTALMGAVLLLALIRWSTGGDVFGWWGFEDGALWPGRGRRDHAPHQPASQPGVPLPSSRLNVNLPRALFAHSII
jgi:hypothetical protein